MGTRSASEFPNLRCLTDQEVQEVLPVNRTTLWRLRKRKVDPLPHFRAGRRVVYPLKQVEAWIERQARIQVASQEPKRKKA